jgi:hypothetical protein
LQRPVSNLFNHPEKPEFDKWPADAFFSSYVVLFMRIYMTIQQVEAINGRQEVTGAIASDERI